MNKIKSLPTAIRYLLYGLPAMIVIVVLVVILVNMLIPREYDRVTIENEGALSGMSGDKINDFRTGLIGVLQEEGYVGEDATVDDVVVREGSVDTFRNGEEGSVTTFLIDIDSLRQTYRVRVTDAPEDMTDVSTYITCPKIEEMKYPESECRGHYGSTSKAAELYMPYTGVLASGEKYLIKSITMTNVGEQVLQIYLYSCDEAVPPVVEAEAAAREFVQSVGDDGDYVYNVRTGYCEGDAI